MWAHPRRSKTCVARPGSPEGLGTPADSSRGVPPAQARAVARHRSKPLAPSSSTSASRQESDMRDAFRGSRRALGTPPPSPFQAVRPVSDVWLLPSEARDEPRSYRPALSPQAAYTCEIWRSCVQRACKGVGGAKQGIAGASPRAAPAWRPNLRWPSYVHSLAPRDLRG